MTTRWLAALALVIALIALSVAVLRPMTVSVRQYPAYCYELGYHPECAGARDQP